LLSEERTRQQCRFDQMLAEAAHERPMLRAGDLDLPMPQRGVGCIEHRIVGSVDGAIDVA